MHTSVGAIIKNDKGQMLMHLRAFFPPGWACPAGHMEKNQTPEETLLSEVKEETGLTVLNSALLVHEYVDWNQCHRGAIGHDWYVYEVLEWEGEVRKSKESIDLEWVNIDEIARLDLEKVWRHWFEKLGYI